MLTGGCEHAQYDRRYPNMTVCVVRYCIVSLLLLTTLPIDDAVVQQQTGTTMPSRLRYFHNHSTPIPLVEQEMDYPEYRLSNWLLFYISPVILLVGTVGNALCLAVLRTKTFHHSSLAFTLSALAVVDCSVLYTSMLRLWILSLTGLVLDVRNLMWSGGCKVHLLLTYYLSQLSSWTLVVVTLERTVGVCFPMKAKTISSKSRIIKVWLIVAGILFLFNAHFLFTARLALDPFAIPVENSSNHSVVHPRLSCYVGKEYFFFFHEVWYWIDFILLSALPFLIILVGNIIIICVVLKSVRFRNETLLSTPATPSATPFSPTSASTPFLLHSTTSPRLLPATTRMPSSTAMLIGVSALFLLFTTPSAVFFLISDSLIDNSNPRTMAQNRLAFAITTLLYYMNNALNFFLYCLTGSRFRRAFVDYFRRKRESISGPAGVRNSQEMTKILTNAEAKRLRQCYLNKSDMDL